MRNKYLSFSKEKKTTPFDSAEEAWFWCCLCEGLEKGSCHRADSNVARPCETSDIIIAVKRLAQMGILRPSHVKVLSKYGTSQVPPHPHFGDSLKICELWREGLNFLDVLLRKKGIVAG
ncbi:MAG: hypothetical protein II938_04835 [Alphaproteobacteria bacterium]|nr:hypothetical protein [Alphaproteobacteria bacterium]